MWYLIGLVCIAMFLMAICTPLAYRAGRERARFDKEIDDYRRRLESNRDAPRGPRHAAAEPRAGMAPSSPRTNPARNGVPRPDRTRLAITADDIPRVAVPQPGFPAESQPAGDPAPLTTSGWWRTIEQELPA